MDELELALEAVGSFRKNVTFLLCTSAYPAEAADAHLNRIKLLKKTFDVNIGISDHTLGIGVSVAAIALGACVVEKHLTIKRTDGGHDSAFSLEPEEFAVLVKEGKKAHESLGSFEWSIQDSEGESRRLRRSLYIVKDVKSGEVATRDNVKALRPNFGGPISDLSRILGRKFREDYKLGTPATVQCVDI
jgi:N-acetylneuraminate synthase